MTVRDPWLVAVLLGAAASPAFAHDAPRLDVAAGDTLARRIPRAAIAALELDRTHGHSTIGALLGLGIGLFSGIVVGNSTKHDSEWGESPGTSAAPFTARSAGPSPAR